MDEICVERKKEAESEKIKEYQYKLIIENNILKNREMDQSNLKKNFLLIGYQFNSISIKILNIKNNIKDISRKLNDLLDKQK